MKQIPAPLWTLTIGVVVTLISLWLGFNNDWLPEQASAQSVLVDNFFNVMVVIGTALFLVVEGTIVYCMIQFRRRKGDDTDGLPIEGNLPLEAFWTAIPAVIVIGLGIYSVQIFQDMGGFTPGDAVYDHGTRLAHSSEVTVGDFTQAEEGDETLLAKAVYGIGAPLEKEGQSADFEVNVAGMQYAWIFTYPETGIVDGELHVPVNADVKLNISANDVIHSFWVPQFRLKQDAIPGKNTELRFVATKVGTYPVVCAELCGGYHGAMRTQVIVHNPSDFNNWLEQRTAQADTGAHEAIAANPADLSDEEYLAPYSNDIGIEPNLIAHLSE
ncbi:cytochrome c oxidase subunit II [Oscillatoria sp. CS-180]|uniref:cytochrome c oxidase subunit II n=1 Tax=Oscillatoria sp. CS-180 TaxID=3021720 RepID=UPI00232FC6E5|nr:cytochrome c oxidase subunit II [Oscillatoria sp. CS-180]MDB9528508.1 cytochrome c oxidase subunit II [Oscillatoria sp. CS-180]